ncbi:MAG: UMP kinase [Eubacteriales bacterium]|nr:UMP kinase [Eubacteriales bacterium]
MKYKRVLLKLSGEALAEGAGNGIEPAKIRKIAAILARIPKLGVQLGIVVGGGNFWRGRAYPEMDRVTADQIGMLATTMNAMALSDALNQAGAENRVMNAVTMNQITEPYIRKRALRHMEKGRIVIFAGGTGSPYFTTDSAAALRASEIEADLMLKATQVDGVYDSDPHLNPEAKRYTKLSLQEVLDRNLKVMDATAAALCRDNKIKLLVFSLADPENIIRAIEGEEIGTLVY